MHRKMAVILAFSGILACCGSLSATERGLRSKGKEQLLGSFYEKTWAVFIGIDDYANLSYDRQLQQAVRDAQGGDHVVSLEWVRLASIGEYVAFRQSMIHLLLRVVPTLS